MAWHKVINNWFTNEITTFIFEPQHIENYYKYNFSNYIAQQFDIWHNPLHKGYRCVWRCYVWLLCGIWEKSKTHNRFWPCYGWLDKVAISNIFNFRWSPWHHPVKDVVHQNIIIVIQTPEIIEHTLMEFAGHLSENTIEWYLDLIISSIVRGSEANSDYFVFFTNITTSAISDITDTNNVIIIITTITGLFIHMTISFWTADLDFQKIWYFWFYSCSPPGMFLPLDIFLEYFINMLPYDYRGVPCFVTDYPWGVRLLYVCLLLSCGKGYL